MLLLKSKPIFSLSPEDKGKESTSVSWICEVLTSQLTALCSPIFITQFLLSYLAALLDSCSVTHFWITFNLPSLLSEQMKTWMVSDGKMVASRWIFWDILGGRGSVQHWKKIQSNFTENPISNFALEPWKNWQSQVPSLHLRWAALLP